MIIQSLILRLASLGYEYKPEDQSMLEFAVQKAEHMILNRTNTDEIPEGLKEIEIDMICGEFLKLKKGMGQLTGYDFEQVAKVVKLGDTSVDFGSGDTAEQRFDKSVDYLINGHLEDIIRYRVMLW